MSVLTAVVELAPSTKIRPAIAHHFPPARSTVHFGDMLFAVRDPAAAEKLAEALNTAYAAHIEPEDGRAA
jgi:predicted ATP-grasp superfamily ATP-dependent carboligase